VSGPPVKIRDATPADWDFMRPAWADTFRRGSLAVDGANESHYYAEMGRLFAAILPGASARIACDPNDDDVRLGFACYTKTVLHYVYVLKTKELDFRREGVAPMLLDALPINAYSFSTLQFVKRIKPRDRGWQFRPRFTYSAS